MLALNSFPGVICGHVEDPVDAYTFAHVNDGNAVSMPFAKGFGWGGELNLEYCFEKLFGAIAGEKFSELFFASCKDEQLAAYIKSLL